LLALTLQRTSRSRTIALFVIVLIATAALTLPIFAPHAFTHLLQQLGQMLPSYGTSRPHFILAGHFRCLP
jgi:hypothetical protein